mgnify:CR=1 FL=1
MVQKKHLKIESIERYENKMGIICAIINGKYRTIYNGEKVGEEKDYFENKTNPTIIVFDSEEIQTTL